LDNHKHLHHGLFLIILIAFIISKATHLDIPYFWDESWVYGPAVNVMGELGPTLLPAHFPLEHSRGHPLFFHFLGGIWIMLFGNSLVSLHSFALSIAFLHIVAFYLISWQLISKIVALAACALLIFQPIFYAQASMVLPEILLSFLCFLSLWACYQKRWLSYFIIASLAIWTKESAVAFIICLFGAAIVNNLTRRVFSAKVLVLTLSPIVSFLVFIVCNKVTFDWYLYPEHTGMLTLELDPFIGKLKAIAQNIFLDQKRLPLTVLGGIALLFLVAKNSDIFKNDLLIYLSIPILGFSIFSAFNFYTVRYILTIFPLVLLLIAWLITETLKKKQLWLSLIITGFMVHSIIQLFDKRSVRDIDLSYLDYGPTQLSVIAFMEENQLYKESIHSGFLTGTALTQKYGGYRNTAQQFTKVNKEMSPVRNYFIFSKLEPHHHHDKIIIHPKSKLLKSFSKGNVRFEIYELEGSL